MSPINNNEEGANLFRAVETSNETQHFESSISTSSSVTNSSSISNATVDQEAVNDEIKERIFIKEGLKYFVEDKYYDVEGYIRREAIDVLIKMANKLERNIQIYNFDNPDLETILLKTIDLEPEETPFIVVFACPKEYASCGYMTMITGDGRSVRIRDYDTSLCNHRSGMVEMRKQDIRLTKIYNKDHSIIGLLNGNFVLVQTDGFSINYDAFTVKEFMIELMDAIVRLYPNTIQTLETRVNMITDNFINFVIGSNGGIKHTYKNKVNDCNREIVNHMTAIMRNIQTINESQTLLRSLNSKLGLYKSIDNRMMIHKQIKNFIDKGMYSIITFNNDSITAKTKEIYLYDNNIRYTVGKFEVKIMLNGIITMRNLTDRIGDLDHPHVSGTYPCLGSIINSIKGFIQQCDYIGLLDIAYHFLCSYNAVGAYRKVYDMNYEAIQWCDKHKSPYETCDCPKSNVITEERCVVCGCLIENCDCLRCPMNDDEAFTNPDSYCDGCDSLNDDGSCGYY